MLRVLCALAMQERSIARPDADGFGPMTLNLALNATLSPPECKRETMFLKPEASNRLRNLANNLTATYDNP